MLQGAHVIRDSPRVFWSHFKQVVLVYCSKSPMTLHGSGILSSYIYSPREGPSGAWSSPCQNYSQKNLPAQNCLSFCWFRSGVLGFPLKKDPPRPGSAPNHSSSGRLGGVPSPEGREVARRVSAEEAPGKEGRWAALRGGSSAG